ncbi:30S ribosomal protein S12 methylthiotransferase RimO [Chloracidobacterium validum]|uniref:Ribosomal protein uS12 methylthiotransferase RimO n=2 Tax=Chloracidobacterium validum TaxID=2821543 RepID=A0ABX8BBE8_9BACT|nr:30S ribosomal protein S12 methylthiotransferase RimO [Chloracidobacterium validum]
MVSLGCPKNLVDSEVMLGLAAQAGYAITDTAGDADVIVVNTCGFIEAAKQESIETILEMAALKAAQPGRRLIVAGCLVERYRDELRTELPEVDAFIGTNELEQLPRLLRSPGTTIAPHPVALRPRGGIPARERTRPDADYLYSETTPRIRTTPRHYAYVKIAEGCDHPCAFCSIPQMRGNLRSRRVGSILAEVERLAAEGVREIILIGQDTTSYGEDLGLKHGLATLLRALAQVQGITWIRFLYAYPTRISDALLDVLASEPKLCRYIDMPLQHAATRMLHAMRRPGSREFMEKLIARIRERVPGVALRTTFIVGYPGETQADFDVLLDFCASQSFDWVGAFVYSDEEGTPAFDLPDKVPARTAEARRAKLMRLQARISKQRLKRFKRQVVDVLFEGPSEDSDLIWQGRLATQAPGIDGRVLITDAPADMPSPQPGDLVQVEITATHTYDLVGRIVANRTPPSA